MASNGQKHVCVCNLSFNQHGVGVKGNDEFRVLVPVLIQYIVYSISYIVHVT